MITQPSIGLKDSNLNLRPHADIIRSLLVRQLYIRGPEGYAGALLGVFILTISLWNYAPRLGLVLWLAAYATLHLLRTILVRNYLKLRHEPTDPWIWERRFAAGTIAGGVLWGAAAIFLFPDDSIPHQYLLALFVVGISCAGAAFYWPSKIVYIPTILVELIAVSGRFFFKADETGIATGIILLLFCAVVLRVARYLNLSETESLRLRLEKEDLVNSLQKARDELETRVKERTADLRREVDQRIEAQESLSKSEERYRLVVDNVQESIYVAQDGRLRFVNPATIESFGYSESELLSKPFVDFIHPDDRELVYQNHLSRLDGGRLPARYSFRILKNDGSARWVEINSVLIQWDKRPAALVFMTDTTDQRKAHEALRQSEERYRSFFDTCRDGVFITTLDGSFIDANDSALEMLGYCFDERAELAERPVAGFFARPEERETYLAIVSKLGFCKDYPTQLRKKDGAVIEVLLTTVVRRDPDGSIAGFQGTVRDVTASKRAEKALKESEERLKLFIEHAPTALAMFDLEMRYVAVSRRWITDYRLDESSILGRSHYEVFCEIPDRWKAAHRRGLAGEVVRSEEDYFERMDGSGQWLRWELHPWRKADGGIGGIIIFAEDITERKEAEQALKASEERYRSLFENMLDGYAYCKVISEDGKPQDFVYLDCNDSFERLTGLKDVVGKNITDVIPGIKESNPELVQACMSVASTGIPEKIESYVQPLGMWLYASVYSAGKDHIVTLFDNITEQKKAQQEALEAERRFRALVEDASSIPVQGYDSNRRVFFWNAASEKLYGYSREEALGKRLEDLIIPPAMRDDVIAAVDNWMEHGQRIPAGELDLMHKDGSIVPVHSTHVMLEGLDGRREMYCVDLDLKDLKRGEEERTSLREQLLQAQKMEAVGTLAGGIAHDFNNLLQVILGFGELLMDGIADDDPNYSDLRKIISAGRSGAELVQHLLTFGRKVEPKLTDINLNQRLRHMQKLLGRSIPKMIEIRLELAEALDMINADPGQIEQVIMNLALNARDAMDQGGTLVLRTENITLDDEATKFNVESKSGAYVLMTISDTGRGMDTETMRHIFEPFYTTKEMGRGTGLGLAMVYGIVKQHGGHITCESEVGKGSTFKTYLPAKASEDELVPELSDETAPLGTETLLLVDDETFVRELGERILTSGGYTVLTAENGVDALKIYEREQDRVALVILDLIMPTMGGTDCLKKILRINPHVKVLIASGYSGDSSRKECFELGAEGFVAKPFRVKELLMRVRKIMDES
jgi:two-component system, cell cycle sensor histidine kinase and response regulator CckA